MSNLPVTISDVRAAEPVIRRHISAVPLVRSYPLEQALGLAESRRVWIKDYGWTPAGSFKLYGGLNWMERNHAAIGDRPVIAHSSGNFASGIAYAGMRYGQRVIVVMPESAPRIKFERTHGFGAEVRTYDAARDHITGDRERMTRELVDEQGGVRANPYDDPHVIAGNGVGGLEIVADLSRESRTLSHFFCPVSGGGLMAGVAIAIANGFPEAQIISVEPAEANDFQQSLAKGERTRISHPRSICDGLLSYDVGATNWPILQQLVQRSLAIPDLATRRAMKWLYERHGLRAEPSGAISLAAVLGGEVDLGGAGDVVIVLSGRNVDEDAFRAWIDCE
jgi:threonine dehydratase